MATIKIKTKVKRSDIIKLRQQLKPYRTRLKKIAETSKSVDNFIERVGRLGNIEASLLPIIQSSMLSVNKSSYKTFLSGVPKISVAAKRATRLPTTVQSAITTISSQRAANLAALPNNVVSTINNMRANGTSDKSILRYINEKVPERIDRQIDLQSTNIIHDGNAEITKARSEAIGIHTFIWHTQRDSKVRPMHADLDGYEFEANDPPVCEPDGLSYFPGTERNCRCYAQPKADDRDLDIESTTSSLIPTLGLLAGMQMLSNAFSSKNTPPLSVNERPSDLVYDPDLVEVDMSYERELKPFNGEEIILQQESPINPKKGLYPRDRQIKREAAYAAPKDGQNAIKSKKTRTAEEYEFLPGILLPLLTSTPDDDTAAPQPDDEYDLLNAE